MLGMAAVGTRWLEITMSPALASSGRASSPCSWLYS
ncbi:MAG: hypothetical protein CM15mP77_3530 [Synechococcus sp.]|nr:MAG: hypothetical protein CM15mP77_3530 [Synechococcus sp.]